MNLQKHTLQPGNRHYTLALPEEYSSDQPTPLILSLHFAGHGMPYYGSMLLSGLVAPSLQALGAIIVAPDCTAAHWAHPQSEADVLELLDHIEDQYNIDTKKTLVTGYSMGGAGAYYMASRHQDRFAAALVMAGFAPSNIIDVEWRIPLYVIHSRQDEVVPIKPAESLVRHLKERGGSVEWVVLEGITHYETHRFMPALQAAVPWILNVWS